MDISSMPKLAIAPPATVVWWVFGVIVAIYALVSLSLVYHWGKYSYRPVKTGFVAGIYFSGSLILITIMFLNILAYLSFV